MSKLHIIRFLGRTDEKRGRHRQQGSIYNSHSRRLGPSGRLPARRRDPWPKHLDTPPFHRGTVPRTALADAEVGSAGLCRALLQAVPVLGMRRGLPGLLGSAEASGEQPRRVFAVAVPGSQRRQQEAGEARV